MLGVRQGGAQNLHLQFWQAIRPGPSFSCATASQAVDKVLELEQQHFKNITVKDGAGRAIDLDELSSLCEAGEDRN